MKFIVTTPTTTSTQPNITSTEIGFDMKMTAPPPPHHQTHCFVVVINLSSVNLPLDKSRTIKDKDHIKDNIQDNIKGNTKDHIKDNLKNT